jgi:hypothetical protein
MIKPHKDPKIGLIQNTLASHLFQIEDIDNGIRVHFNPTGYNKCSVDIYVLRNNPNFIRAKLRNKKLLPEDEKNYLNRIHSSLQNALSDIAVLEKFHLLGNRENFQLYYAHLTLTREFQNHNSDLRLTPLQRKIIPLEDIDSKRVRNILDQIKLPRSSMVRVAITRIFRESVDSTEMKALIVREAQKIIKPSEKELLKQLQQQKLPPSISAIVHLLSENLP